MLWTGLMSGLTRYVFWQLLVGMILVTAGLTCVIWLSQSLRFVDMIVNRGLTAGMFVYLTALLLPNFLAIIMPIALFTVVVFTYSKLITDRELVVMSSAGLSHWAIAKPAVILAFIVVIISFALNLYFLPTSYRMFRELQWDIRYSYTHILLQEGAFNTMSPDITVYVRQRTKDGQLLGILVHDGRKKEKPSTLMAERGALVEGRDGARVVMFNGSRQDVDKNTNKLSVLYFDRYAFELGRTRENAGTRFREARERMVGELFEIEKDKTLDPKNYGKFRVEGHKRLVSPLFAIGFTMIGLACLLTGATTHRGHTRRIILGVAMVVAVQAAALGLENAIAKNLSLIPVMYANALLPVLAGGLAMALPRWRWRRSSEPEMA